MKTASICTEYVAAARRIPSARPWTFFRQWLTHPLQLGTVVPSSRHLCRRLAAQVRCADGEAMIELGARTGVVSRALLESGLPAERLFVVEIVPELGAHLRRVLPGANVIEGDARRLPDLIPPA